MAKECMLSCKAIQPLLPLVGNSTSISKGSMVLWKRFHKDRSKFFCVIIMSLQLLSLTISLQLLGGKNPIELYDGTSIKNKFTADYLMNFHLAYLVFVISFCSSFYLILMKLFVSDASWKRPAEAYYNPVEHLRWSFFAKIVKNMCFFNVPKCYFLISFVFFNQPSSVVIMTTPLMINSTQKFSMFWYVSNSTPWDCLKRC